MSIASRPAPTSNQLRQPDPAEMARVAAARRGNQLEFSSLTEPYRRELQVHCYRILGSRQEAEDLVQETLLRAWRRLDTYAGRATFRAWLYKIATNACLDRLDRQRTRRLLPWQAGPASDPRAPLQPPALEPVWLEPVPDEWLAETALAPEARYNLLESVSLAFLAALQGLPARQRAVLILSDVLDWPARDVADLLKLTVSAVNSALHRARVTVAAQYHGHAPEGVARPLTDERTQQLLERYVRAWQNADVAGLVALLKEDASFAMPPSPSWLSGRSAIGTFAAATVFGDSGMFGGRAAGRWQLRAAGANGQPAFALYQRAASGSYKAFGLLVLTLGTDHIAAATCFIDPALPAAFGQPAVIEG
jgi:RNA polymerase sigma-70 factor (ECF subfamily)